jgi:hypothetical protein
MFIFMDLGSGEGKKIAESGGICGRAQLELVSMPEPGVHGIGRFLLHAPRGGISR